MRGGRGVASTHVSVDYKLVDVESTPKAARSTMIKQMQREFPLGLVLFYQRACLGLPDEDHIDSSSVVDCPWSNRAQGCVYNLWNMIGECSVSHRMLHRTTIVSCQCPLVYVVLRQVIDYGLILYGK